MRSQIPSSNGRGVKQTKHRPVAPAPTARGGEALPPQPRRAGVGGL